MTDKDRAHLRTLPLCREALQMLAPDGATCRILSGAHVTALREAVDAFEAGTTRLDIA